MNKLLISSKIDWITQNVSESVVHWWGKMREITTTDIRIEPGAPIYYRMNSRLAFGDKIISINELFSPSYHMQAASFSLRVISPLVSYLLATFLLNLVFRRFFFFFESNEIQTRYVDCWYTSDTVIDSVSIFAVIALMLCTISCLFINRIYFTWFLNKFLSFYYTINTRGIASRSTFQCATSNLFQSNKYNGFRQQMNVVLGLSD